MCDETYHGWTNRETWAFHRWISDEQATASEAKCVVMCAAAGARAENRDDAARGDAAWALHEWWKEVLAAARENGYNATLDAMRDEVGSLWRVDWEAIADAMLDEEQSQ